MSKSEKVILIILCVTLIGIFYYQFIFRAQVKKLDELRAEKDNVEQQLNILTTKVAQIPAKTKRYNELVSQMKKGNISIYPLISQERLMLEIDSLMKNAQLDGPITFSKPVSTKPELTQEMINKSNANNTETKNPTQKLTLNDVPAVENMNVDLNVSGSFENLKSFIDSIQNYSRNIIIPKIGLTSAGNGNVTATMTLEIYAVKQVAEDDYGTKWDLNGAYGKENPFKN